MSLKFKIKIRSKHSITSLVFEMLFYLDQKLQVFTFFVYRFIASTGIERLTRGAFTEYSECLQDM